MLKSELVKEIAKKSKVRKSVVLSVIDCMTDTIMNEVANGNEVSIIGFGKFLKRTVKQKKRFDINKGKYVIEKETATPRFYYGKVFKRKVKEE